MTSDPNHPDGSPKTPNNNGLEVYNTIAETVGLIPSLRLRDNVIQAIIIGIGTCISVIIGAAMGGTTGALVAAIVGLVVSLLISGFVLMILGWIRAAKKLK